MKLELTEHEIAMTISALQSFALRLHETAHDVTSRGVTPHKESIIALRRDADVTDSLANRLRDVRYAGGYNRLGVRVEVCAA